MGINTTLTYLNKKFRMRINIIRNFLKYIFSILYKLYYDRIEVSKEFDINMTSESKKCEICHHWYFLNKRIKFQPNACNGCHDLLIMSLNLSDIAILNINSSDYRCINSGVSKKRDLNLMQNVALTKKSKHYKI